MNIGKQMRAAGCACKAPQGAGVSANYHITGYSGAVHSAPIVTQAMPDPWQDQPESYWPTGSRAELAEPYEADRGAGLPPKLVSVFEKKSNGRWLSQPGNDISFSSLYQLRNAALVVRVTGPEGIDTSPEPEPEPQAETQAGTIDPITGDVPDAPDTPESPARTPAAPFYKTPGGMAAIGGGALAVLAGMGLLAWYALK